MNSHVSRKEAARKSCVVAENKKNFSGGPIFRTLTSVFAQDNCSLSELNICGSNAAIASWITTQLPSQPELRKCCPLWPPAATQEVPRRLRRFLICFWPRFLRSNPRLSHDSLHTDFRRRNESEGAELQACDLGISSLPPLSLAFSVLIKNLKLWNHWNFFGAKEKAENLKDKNCPQTQNFLGIYFLRNCLPPDAEQTPEEFG